MCSWSIVTVSGFVIGLIVGVVMLHLEWWRQWVERRTQR